jgi:hypothetical protein
VILPDSTILLVGAAFGGRFRHKIIHGRKKNRSLTTVRDEAATGGYWTRWM